MGLDAVRAGAVDRGVVGGDAAVDAVYEVAQGNLRSLDTIALKALYQAAAEGVRVCGVEHVIAARALIAA